MVTSKAAQKVISAAALAALSEAILKSAGLLGREARLVADHLVEANLRGHDSHGVGMLPDYVRNIRSGDLAAGRSLAILIDTGSLLLCDAAQGAGQAMAHDAMELGIARAGTHGLCVTALRNSHHIGRIGHYAEQCARAGLVSIHFVNVAAQPAVAPFGGTSARLGTNPFAVGIPRADSAPVILDFATSVLAVGKVRVALNKGETVPPGALVDALGKPTTDPSVLFSDPRGALRAFGAHKGSGLSLVCEILGGALTGGQVQSERGFGAAVLNSMLKSSRSNMPAMLELGADRV